MITEGISNKPIQLVHRGDAESRDSSRFSSPGEAVDNQNQGTAGERAIRSLDLTDKVDLSQKESVSPGQAGLSNGSDEKAAAMKEAESVVKDMVQELNSKFDRSSLRLRFGTDKESGLEYFQLYDRQNGDVVKQYPPEEMLEMVATLRDLTGVIFNENV